jgi:Rho GTPase-activating protein 18/28/40
MIKYHETVTSTPYRIINEAPVSFENMIRETEKSSDGSESETIEELCSDINDIPEGDLKRLQPILWLELATIFDKNHIALDRRKPFKRKRKEEGNVFGVSLNALVRRDQQVTEEDTSLVPLILQYILRELTERGAREEGILRVAGHKQKVSESFFSYAWLSHTSSFFILID